jgi:hypothetical protein
MSCIVQCLAPVFAYMSLNCLFYVICYASVNFKFLLSVLFLCYYFMCFSFYFVWSVICIVSSDVYYCSLPFVYNCKIHFHWVETHLHSINIILYHIIISGEIILNITLWWLGYWLFIFVALLEENFYLVFLSLLGHTPG